MAAGASGSLYGKSQKVCQLTGDTDREWGYPTVNRTTQHEIWGTDLGQPVEHNGRIFYFFGDTVTTRPKDQDNWNHDSYASSTDYTPEDCLHLDFLTEDGSDRFRALTIPGVSLEAFETPTGGFSANGNLYVFASSRWNGQYHTRSVLARSRDNGLTFTRMGDVSNDKFINISPVVVDSARWPDLPIAGTRRAAMGQRPLSGQRRPSGLFAAGPRRWEPAPIPPLSHRSQSYHGSTQLGRRQ